MNAAITMDKESKEFILKLKCIIFNAKNEKLLKQFERIIKSIIKIIETDYTSFETEKTIKLFSDMLNTISRQYYYSANPYVSDEDFDTMLNLLESIENKTGIIDINFPTQRIGIESLDDKNLQYEHIKKMKSLKKAKLISNIESFYDDLNIKFSKTNLEKENSSKISFLGMPKYDGMSMELWYENGMLVNAVLRGNGIKGESKINQAKSAIKNILFFVEEKSFFSVTGECLMPYSFFDKVKNIYSNPRNAASGIINNDDYDFIFKMGLKFIAYGSSLENKFNKFSELFQHLKNLKFETAYFENYETKKDILQGISGFGENRNRSKNPNDGFVILVDNIEFYNSLGFTNNEKYPNGSVAFKYEDEVYETKILDSIYSVGQTGKIATVAVVEPTEIDGSVITRATLNSFDFISKMGISPKCIVSIKKSNEVIPKIVDLVEKSTEFYKMPNICPYCGTKLSIKTNLDGSMSKDMFCVNEECGGRNNKNIERFCKVMGIKGMNEKTLNDMNEIGIISSLFDLYKLTELSGYGDKKINNIFDSINDARNVYLDTFINSLNIPNIGESISKDIAKTVISYNKFVELTIKEIEKMSLSDFIKKALIDFFNKIDENIPVYTYLFEAVATYKIKVEDFINCSKIILNNNCENISKSFLNDLESFISKYTGKYIVVTGTAIFGRNAIQKFCKKYNILIQKSVNGFTNVVFCEDDDYKHLIEIRDGKRPCTIKLRQAVDSGKNICGYEELERAINGDIGKYMEEQFYNMKQAKKS